MTELIKASALIERLQAAIDEHGDCPVAYLFECSLEMLGDLRFSEDAQIMTSKDLYRGPAFYFD